MNVLHRNDGMIVPSEYNVLQQRVIKDTSKETYVFFCVIIVSMLCHI